jgi:hypothetical protein
MNECLVVDVDKTMRSTGPLQWTQEGKKMNENEWTPELELDSNESALGQLGFSGEKVDAELAELERESNNKEVCICGHAVRRHIFFEGNWDCQPARIWCPCSQPIAVLEADDLRMFQCQTRGWGAKHALTQGIRKSDKSKKKTRLLENAICWMCGKASNLYPTALDLSNIPIRQPAARNALLCEECLYKAQGIPVEESLH